MKEIDAFLRQVKLNCDISDAKFWGYYSICGLLMRYRDLYRSEQGLLPWDSIPNEEISGWIQERETLWTELETKELQRIIIVGLSFDPFDINSINKALKETCMIYAAGYGTFNKPTFFVAHLETERDLFDYRLYSAGRELCRDLAAAPAMLQGRCIYLRPEVISAFLWDRFEEMLANRPGCFGGEAFSLFGVRREDVPSVELFGKIRNMASEAAEILGLHEAGEAFEDDYSEEWYEILSCGCDKSTELYLRGIKDVRADTSEMGPLKKIIEARDLRGLYLFMIFMDGIRRVLFPEIRGVFQHHMNSTIWSDLERVRRIGYGRATALQTAVIVVWRRRKDRAEVADCVRDIIKKSGNQILP